jgi:hypothetical protein
MCHIKTNANTFVLPYVINGQADMHILIYAIYEIQTAEYIYIYCVR